MSGDLVPYIAHRATSRDVARVERGAVVERLKLLAAGERGLIQEGYDFRFATTRVARGFELAEIAMARSAKLYQAGVAAVQRCGGSEDVAELVLAQWASVTHTAFARTQRYINGGV